MNSDTRAGNRGWSNDCGLSSGAIKLKRGDEMTTPSVSPQPSDLALSPDLPGADQVPAAGEQSVLVTGLNGPLSNLLQLAQSGQIWIAYEWGDAPARYIVLWHQGGATQPINPGWNNFTVNAGDAIMWTLSSPTNSIKIAWQYA